MKVALLPRWAKMKPTNAKGFRKDFLGLSKRDSEKGYSLRRIPRNSKEDML